LKSSINKFLFNFSVSYLGGGFKRLYAYASWFNKNGGAYFLIHPSCRNLIREFPKNKFFLIGQAKYQRVFDDCAYLDSLKYVIEVPDLYYSYGIPIYRPFGRINWFHLSNVLPIYLRGVPLPLFDRLKLAYLGARVKTNLINANVISAESQYSLGLIGSQHSDKLFLSVNGSDDEMSYFHHDKGHAKESIAVVVGTYSYKRITDSFLVFKALKDLDNELKLVIIGDKKNVSESVSNGKDVLALGLLPREEVVEYLRRAKYYISTTAIENSYNSASEGIFFANESYISDIGPHRELLGHIPFDQISIPGVFRPLLHVKRENLSTLNLKTWHQIIEEMILHIIRKSSARI